MCVLIFVFLFFPRDGCDNIIILLSFGDDCTCDNFVIIRWILVLFQVSGHFLFEIDSGRSCHTLKIPTLCHDFGQSLQQLYIITKDTHAHTETTVVL